MINAWSLLYEELNGTMDKTYPIESNESNNENINITTGIGSTGIYNVPEDLEVEKVDPNLIDPPITIGGADEGTLNISGGDFINFDLGIGTTDLVDTINLDLGNYSDPFIAGADVITFSGDDPRISSPPGIESNNPRKYKEDESIKALQDYISTTYGGHYTSKENNVQTLDLIESVGDAESFCRSNAIKYLSRYDKKGQAKRDILKALHYTLLLYHFSGQLKETTTRGYETF